MGDMIERNEAVKRVLDLEQFYKDTFNESRPPAYAITEALKDLPSAQPKQKVGKWIIKDNPGTGWYRVTCSECGEDVTSEIRLIGFIPNCKALWDYCPYCGAKVEEQDE